ncbi:hypothetical protein GGI42DRAFT_136229 [Trichoderma sp. SZMC 28013]
MSSAALNGGKRHVHVLARGWSKSSGHPRTADAAHRRRFGCPWLGPVKIGGWCGVCAEWNIDGPFHSIYSYPYRVVCAEAGSEHLNRRGTENRLWDLPGRRICPHLPRFRQVMALVAAFQMYLHRLQAWRHS